VVNTIPDTKLLPKNPPENVSGLISAIKATSCVHQARTFEQLEEAIFSTDNFLSEILPFIWEQARLAPTILPSVALLDSAGTITLSQKQCLCILANAFFCTYTDRLSHNCENGHGMPSINFDELYGARWWGNVEVAKLQMLFAYFDTCRQRMSGSDALNRPIHFIRQRAECSSAEEWKTNNELLLPVVMHPLFISIDDAKEMLRVDFANRIVGGAAIAYGSVQEEIMFCACPELIASRLFCPSMRANEAIIYIGVEQFSKPEGYGGDLAFGGLYNDPTRLRDDGSIDSHIAAIDALDLRSTDLQQQYSPEMIMRELTKVWAAFGCERTPQDVATGNWGCGIFGGDVELKSLIQWIACSRAGKILHYFPWNNENIYATFPEIAKILTEKRVTIGDLTSFLLEKNVAGSVFSFVREYYN
jgi:poly(ADP-ribose) glycohydrolase